MSITGGGRVRRFFNDRERVALYLAADGCCTSCGAELEAGWHADHMNPHSGGGPTDVINGQALCPPCNLRKGSNVNELRLWQQEALRRWAANRRDFLAVATPGAGKTTFAIEAAKEAIASAESDRLIVVVPTKHLRSQWAKAAAKEGVQLDYRFANGAGAIARDFDGVVVTYAAVASEPLLWRKHASSARTLVILDEIHHAGDRETLSWGPALRTAFEPATRRLLLSGTPFRTDGSPIPFVQYDAEGRAVASYEYGYKLALQDRNVVRPIEFPVLDGTMRWRFNKIDLEAELSKVDNSKMAQALASALSPDGEWMPSVLRRADEELTRAREVMADAGGLVIASDVMHAKRYADILRSITGQAPELATIDESDASDRIERFAGSEARWLVAVDMVSEGVDIPRLAVGVYAARKRTEMFFRQVAGRFVRMRSPSDETYASLIIPAIEPLVRFARDIEETASTVLREQSEEKIGPGPPRDPFEFELVEAEHGRHTSTVVSGQAPTEAELERARVAMSAAGVSGISVAQAALLLRVTTAPAQESPAQEAPRQDRPAETRPLADEKHRLSQRVARLVGRYGKVTGADYKRVHASLNKHFREDSIKQATKETLRGRVALLERWIAEA
jgi:superfamily II DNA or RNA helicase